jgi:hypothetical protein
MPLQHSSPVAAQSFDVEQAFGQGVFAGLRQRPPTFRAGSIALTVVQQISPDAVLQSLLLPQAFGQLVGGRQTGSL